MHPPLVRVVGRQQHEGQPGALPVAPSLRVWCATPFAAGAEQSHVLVYGETADRKVRVEGSVSADGAPDAIVRAVCCDWPRLFLETHQR